MNIRHQPGLPGAEPTEQHLQRQLSQLEQQDQRILSSDDEDGNISDDTSIQDEDDAQAALQPAISAAASHLTSAQTPAAEKAAALERAPGGGYFDSAIAEGDAEDDFVGSSTPYFGSSPERTPRPGDDGFGRTRYKLQPRTGSPGRQLQPPEQLPLPSPWTAGPKNTVVNNKEPQRSHETKGVLGSVFGPTRPHRSRSAGQEALKKLQKAFPSFSSSSNFLPSFSSSPSSFFSNLTGDNSKSGHTNSSKPSQGARPRSVTLTQYHTSKPSNYERIDATDSERRDEPTPLPLAPLRANSGALGKPRPPVLRRATSDESMLYHSLSRQSSLGDDNRFSDVREMVNIRFMALRDSLPDRPNFKMPSLPKFPMASRMSSLSLNGIFSSSTEVNSLDRQRADGSPGMLTGSPGAVSSKGNGITGIDSVLDNLTGDIVLLGGYRGSVLRSAEPPHQQLWAPVKLGFNMRKANLEVGLEDDDEDTMEERIIPSGMLKHIGPVDISRKLFKKLRSSPNARNGTLRVWDFGYDWRLSPSILSKRLEEFLSGLPSNQKGVPSASRGAIVIAHSLGGLITRHVINRRPELFQGVLYAGVPQRCINILGPFRHGDAVLFNDKLLTAQVNFSLRTSFLLLPDDGLCFIDKHTGEEYPVDFFNADNWAKWHLSPCVAPALPAFNRDTQQPTSSPLTSLFPKNSHLKSKKTPEHLDSGNNSNESRRGAASPPSPPSSAQPSPPLAPTVPSPSEEEARYMAYLRRTLASVSKFRSELAHSENLESSNSYPPHAVLYGKTIPTVYAAQVASQEAISYKDAYDDLLFRPGDGVVLAREAMIPQGYSIARGGRVSTERGHLTMLGDMPAVGRALEALLRGRRKGIGLGKGKGSSGA